MPWSLDTCSTQRSHVHRVPIHGISNGDTYLCTPHTNYSRFSDNSDLPAAQWEDQQDWAVWLNNLTRIRMLIPYTGNHAPGMTLYRRTWVRLIRNRIGVECFHSCLHKWVWSPLRPVSVAQKNKPLTMLSSNI